MSIETTAQSGNANNQTADEIETIPNPERGCGFLKQGKAYLRSDVGTGGHLPAFVAFEEPIPFKEDRKRSYKQFPGIQFELAVTGAGGLTETSPPDEVTAHIERLSFDRTTGRTAGEMVEFHSHDLLMSVGKTHYETPEEFINEARVHGVNKAVSVTSGNEPPAINPGRTRLFLIHPNAVEVTETRLEEQEVEKTETVELPNGDEKTVTYTETEMVEVEEAEYVPGIIGYTYLTRCIYTEDADGNVPKYIQDYEATGGLDVVQTGDPVPYTEQAEFNDDGEFVGMEQETLPAVPEEAEETDDAEAESEPESIESMERADLGALLERSPVEGNIPPEGEDVFVGDEGGALAVVTIDDESCAVMPSNNLSIEDGDAKSVVGPYRLTVADTGEIRTITVSKTR
jgi:hypothetical protein